jgi:hypothetical protein
MGDSAIVTFQAAVRADDTLLCDCEHIRDASWRRRAHDRNMGFGRRLQIVLLADRAHPLASRRGSASSVTSGVPHAVPG